MMSSRILTAALVVLAAASKAGAQAPCSLAPAVLDSARDDAMVVLTSSSRLVSELRKEQNMTTEASLSTITPVKERYVCAKMAGAFDHIIPPGKSFAVLRIGQVYYARDPDQKRSTGVITDTTFNVLMRLGVTQDVPEPKSAKKGSNTP
jgi:hypothetical protein